MTPSAVSNKVYALGTIGYDFGSEARRDTFKQKMSAVDSDGTITPANPYDARQMVNYLEQNPTAAKSLIWTLNLDSKPIYVVEPKRAFASDIYETLIQMLAGQAQGENSEDYIERVSIPGRLQNKTVELFSGQVLPVVELENSRGMYGWQVNDLVRSALEMVRDRIPAATDEAMQRSLNSFLQRIYFELGNLGQLARERALNFAATNAFQAASTFAEAIALGMQLDKIKVEKSPFCRLHSDCWDVILTFSDPENSHRAKKVFRFTIDVKDTIPVTLGDVRSWSIND
ncbi:MAG: PatA/PatG family cyanobactin maturation protease [Leptolyngbya sp. SIO1D8]|nr:PatA/PatG family cyanobactin maturation protease [Leptolyngbya sp. SIO1D8]